MPHYMVCDRFHSDAPTEQLLDLGTPGMEAIALWTLAGSLSQAQLSDGQLTLGSLARLVGSKARAQKAAKLLVRVGLWEEFLDEDAQPSYQFVDWFTFHKPGAGVRLQRAREAEKKKPEVVEPVKARDGDRCRYCCSRVNWKDRRGKKGATYDHVDPLLGPVGPTNLVVACFDCNRVKSARTPEQAALTLHVPRCAGGGCGCTNPPATAAPAWESAEKAAEKPEKNPAVSAKSQTDTENEPDNDTLRPSREPSGDLAERCPRRSRTRTRTGTEEGSGPGVAPGAPRVAVEGRGGGGPPRDAPPPPPPPPASAYPQPVGSPWFDHRGPPPDVDEPKCPAHGLDLPCRKCRSEHYSEEATPG